MGATARATYYADVLQPGSTPANDYSTGAKTTVDLEGRFQVTDRVGVAVGVTVGVTVGVGEATTLTVSVNETVALLPAASVTVTVTTLLPAAVGVPEISPLAASIETPPGRPEAL